MSGGERRRAGGEELTDLIGGLGTDELRYLLETAAGNHEDVAASVRLTASRLSGDFAALKVEIDRGLRTKRFLDHRESTGWAAGTLPIVAELRHTVDTMPTAAVVGLIERAVGHVVKVILQADDSDGAIGDVARDLLALHSRACDTGVADPVKLARWMVRFTFDDQDFFVVDPVRYAPALGATGVAEYRKEVGKAHGRHPGSFAGKYATERLAVLDGDTERIVGLLGGDLSTPHQYIRVAKAMEELGRDDDVLSWATRGITNTTGWQISQLYDLAVAVHDRRGDTDAALALRRQHHHQMPSTVTYGKLRTAAEHLDRWDSERGPARATLAERDLGGAVDVLLADGEADTAWQVTVDNPDWDPGPNRWSRLAAARAASNPTDALTVYLNLADLHLQATGRAAYFQAAKTLKQAQTAAQTAGEEKAFASHLHNLCAYHRRRPTLITILDEAGLST